MTDTDIRVQLAKKLGWKYREPRPPWAGYWSDPIGNPTELPSLYDLCLQGEERLTKEQQQAYSKVVFENFAASGVRVAYSGSLLLFRLITAPLEVRAKALIEVLP